MSVDILPVVEVELDPVPVDSVVSSPAVVSLWPPVESSSEPVVDLSSLVAAPTLAELGPTDVGPPSAAPPATHVPPRGEPADTG